MPFRDESCSRPALLNMNRGVSKMILKKVFRVLICSVLGAALWAGCLQVRTVEHRIKLNKDGSGEHMLRLLDIRSDGTTDSAVTHDFNVMMSSYDQSGGTEFNTGGRSLTYKRLYTHSNALIAEVTYSFKELAAVEGLRVRGDELFVVVGSAREIVKTNGKVRSTEKNQQTIVWDRDAPRLFYVIREKEMPPSLSLAPYFRARRK